MMNVTRIALLAGAALAPLSIGAQAAGNVASIKPGTDSVVVTASRKYGASGVHRFLLGDNYRDIWAQPITVPVLDLGTYAGGLKALEEGGNAQTRNLHLRGADGKEYVFRPVFKEVLQLDEIFEKTIIEDIFADGLSASHPAATVLPSPLLEAAGVLHASPVLYVMPDDERLGEFRGNFANKLGTMEEFPEDPKESTGFGGAYDIIDSEDLLERINKDGTTKIDAHALLTARLIDMLIGDNDRHPGQWKWAQLRDDKNARWVPIPRDRDKAFVSYEGALLKAARLALPRLVTFRTEPQTALFYNAVDFDRRLLVSLTHQDFDSTAKFLQRVLTDSVINHAVSLMPREYQKVEPELADRLRSRRDKLAASAAGYYKGLFSVVDLHGTDDDDRAIITRQADGKLQVTLASSGSTYFDREFDPAVTKEVRLYLHDGNDEATITGDAPRSVPLWVVGGKGRNNLVDSSVVGGRQRPTRIYDNGGTPDATVMDESNGTVALKVDSAGKKPEEPKKAEEPAAGKQDSAGKPAPEPYDADTAWNRRPAVEFQGWEVPPFRDRGQSLRVVPSVSFGRGYGIKPSLKFTRTKYGFRQYPYASRTELELAYATDIQGWELILETDNRFESSRMFFATETGLSQIITGRFGGFGNDVTHEDSDVTRLNQGQWWIQPAIGWALNPAMDISLGPVVKYTNTDSTPGSVVAELQPYGFRRFGQAGVMMRFTREAKREDVVDRGTAEEILKAEPERKLDVEATAAFYPPVWDATSSFGTVSAWATYQLTLGLPLRPILATRLGGQRVWGEFPFFEAAFLGGSESVRTLRRQELSGDASVYGTAELRLPVAQFPLVLPLNLGIFGFTDVGRVYMDGESPGGWHSGYGGGLWLGVIKSSANLTLTFTNSRDRRTLLTTGFVF